MPKNNRFTGTTYYDQLNAYFERQFVAPLTANEQAVMTHILHLCNVARGDTISTTREKLSLLTNVSRSSVGHALSSLVQKNYITVSPVDNVCTIIGLNLDNHWTTNNEKNKAESHFLSPRKEKEKKKQERKIGFRNFSGTAEISEEPRKINYTSIANDLIECSKVNRLLNREISSKVTKDDIDKAIELGYKTFI